METLISKLAPWVVNYSIAILSTAIALVILVRGVAKINTKEKT